MSVEQKERLKPAKEAVMFLLYRDGKFLFELRKDPSKVFYGKIVIPGGKVEVGEIPEDTAPREAKEEYGVIVKSLVWLGEFIDEADEPAGEPTRVYAFLVPMFEGRAESKEPDKSEMMWLTAEGAHNVIKVPSSRKVLNLAQDYLIEEAQSKG